MAGDYTMPAIPKGLPESLGDVCAFYKYLYKNGRTKEKLLQRAHDWFEHGSLSKEETDFLLGYIDDFDKQSNTDQILIEMGYIHADDVTM